MAQVKRNETVRTVYTHTIGSCLAESVNYNHDGITGRGAHVSPSGRYFLSYGSVKLYATCNDPLSREMNFYL